jgi:hypothetical protein
MTMDVEQAFADFTVAGLAALAERDIERRLADMSDEAAARLLEASEGGDADDPS